MEIELGELDSMDSKYWCLDGELEIHEGVYSFIFVINYKYEGIFGHFNYFLSYEFVSNLFFFFGHYRTKQ